MAVDDAFVRLVGTQNSSFAVGGPPGPKIKNDSGVLASRNAADDEYSVHRAAGVGGTIEDSDLPNFRNLQSFFPDISFSFDGSDPPTPGDNSGEYGICHTDGAGYSAGNIYFDATTSLVLVSQELCSFLTTRISVSGTVSLIQRGTYRRDGTGWNLVGDGGGGSPSIETEIFSYTDESNRVVGPIGNVPETLDDNLFYWGPILQFSSEDYTIRPVSGGSTPGYYICIATNSSAPGGGTFAGGTNPTTGMMGFVEVNDPFKLLYQPA